MRPGLLLDVANLGQDGVERGRHLLVHQRRVVALDEMGLVAVAPEQGGQLRLRDSREDRRVGDLVAVEVQDRQDRAVVDRVEERVRQPARGKWPGLRLAVADDAGHEQIGVVERGPERVRERVAELAAFVDRTRRFRGDVAGMPPGNENWRKSRRRPSRSRGDGRVDLGVGALEVGVGHRCRPAVTRPDDVHRVEAVAADHAIQVCVEEVEAGCRAPVAQQSGLDVLGDQRPTQQGVVEQVDLADREVVGGPPVGVDQSQVLSGSGGPAGLGFQGVGHRRRIVARPMSAWRVAPRTRPGRKKQPRGRAPREREKRRQPRGRGGGRGAGARPHPGQQGPDHPKRAAYRPRSAAANHPEERRQAERESPQEKAAQRKKNDKKKRPSPTIPAAAGPAMHRGKRTQ